MSIMAENLDVLTPDQLNLFMNKKGRNTFSFFHLNVQSARTKGDDLMILFDSVQSSFNIIMLTETWYKDDDDFFVLPGYNHFYLNRNYGRGGGVSLQANVSDLEILSDYSVMTRNYEILCVRRKRDIFSVLYRPPGGNVEVFLNFLETLLCFANEEGCELFLGGDVNINLLEESRFTDDFLTLLTSNNFCNVITPPTRVTTTSSTLIDVFVTNHEESCISAGVLGYGLSDHLPIIMFIKKTAPQPTEPVNIDKEPTITTRSINPTTLEQFRLIISSTNWDSVFSATSANEAYDKFLNIFKNIYDRCFPYKQIKQFKKNRKPWVNRKCWKMIQKKNKLYNVFLKTKKPEDLALFKQFRNTLNNALRQAKKTYLNNLFNESCMDRTDVVWKRLNEVLKRGPSKPAIHVIKRDDVTLQGKVLAEAFNSYLTNLVSSTHIPSSMAYMKPRNEHSAVFFPTDQNEIISIMSSLKNSNSCDIDDLQIKPIKHVLDFLSPVLTHIMNLSLSSGLFPKKMQTAKVIVLYKGGNKNEFSNYRPISILPVFSKCLEKIIHNRVTSFCTKFSLISDSQYGFRRGRSTEFALLEQKELILKSFEEKKLIMGVFIDFSKAFDRIDHITLIKKLECYGIRGIPLVLLQSYLTFRQQYVVINGHSSSVQPIRAGVPQGSILGPLLFNLYINDIVNISKVPSFIIYADDTSLFFSGIEIEDLGNETNTSLEKLYNWSEVNSLVINTSKSKAVLFKPKNRRISSSFNIILGPSVIEIVPNVKTLGVYFNEQMSWDTHVNNIVKKLSRVLGKLCQFRNLLPRHIKMLIYKALFMPHLNYCNLVWCTTSLSNINKLHLLEKKAVRTILNVPFDTHTPPLFKELCLITVPDLYEYNLLTRYRSTIRSNEPFLVHISNLTLNFRVYDVREGENWKIPTNRTNYGFQMLRYNLPFVLNKLQRHNFVNVERLDHSTIRNFFLH